MIPKSNIWLDSFRHNFVGLFTVKSNTAQRCNDPCCGTHLSCSPDLRYQLT